MQVIRRSFWDYMFYFCLSVILIWLALKLAGIINTPPWLEYGVPILGVVGTFFALYQSLVDKIIVLSVGSARMDERLGNLEGRVERVDNRLDGVDRRIEHVDKDLHVLKEAVAKTF